MFCFSCILFEMLKMELQGEGLIYTFPKLNCGGPTWNALFRCIKHTSKFHIGYHDLSIQNMYSNSPPKKQTRQLRLGVTRRWEGPSKNNQSILWWVHEKNFSLESPFVSQINMGSGQKVGEPVGRIMRGQMPWKPCSNALGVPKVIPLYWKWCGCYPRTVPIPLMFVNQRFDAP